jgi:hypothetical protein
MPNRIVKDFKNWNLITEISDMVGAKDTAPTGTVGGGSPGSNIPTSGVAPKAPAGTSGTAGRGTSYQSGATAGIDGTAATSAQLLPAAVDKLSKEIAEMIVALFANTRAFWAGENDLKLNATGMVDDNEETGVKIFEDYWTKNITPKINILPAGNKNKETLTAAKTQISAAINARNTSFTFQIVTSASKIPTSYTINPDF